MKKYNTEIMNAIKARLKDIVNVENYGCLASKTSTLNEAILLKKAGIKVDYAHDFVFENETPIFKIEKRYAKRKINLAYRTLMPNLVEINAED